MKSTKQNRHTQRLLVFTAITLVLPGSVAHGGNPGDRDATFGTCGIVVTDFSPDGANGFSLAIQSDGKIVQGGDTGGDMLLVRYNVDGSFDESFGAGGLVVLDLNQNARAAEVLLQPDGRIIAAGNSSVVRFNSNGTLDASFGTGGIQILSGIAINAAALQTDGKIVVAGQTPFQSNVPTLFAVARLLPDGTLDASFGVGGQLTTDFGTDIARAFDVAVQVDGRIVVVGNTRTHDPITFGVFTDWPIVRYNTDGSLDPSFGAGGIVLASFGDGNGLLDAALGVALQTDGKIVATGRSGGGGSGISTPTILRLNTNGSFDAIFGNSGVVTLTDLTSSFAGAQDVVVQSDGKIVVVGGWVSNRMYVARLDSNGSLDASLDASFICIDLPDGSLTFGDGGLMDFGGFGTALAAALQTDGKIVVGGILGNLSCCLVIARVHSESTIGETCDPTPIAPTILGTVVPPGTGAGSVVYENTETAFNRDLGLFDPGVGDDLHLLRAGTLSSFEFTFRENGLQDIFAVVRFFANDPDDLGIIPNTLNEFDPATEIATIRTCVSGLSATEGDLHILSIEPTEPIDLPHDVWMTIDLVFDFVDPNAGTFRIPISSDVEVGTSHEFLLIGGSDRPANSGFLYTFNDLGSLNLDILLRMVPDVSDTPTGMGVVVEPETGVMLTFSNVQQAGITTVTTSGTNPEPDPTFEFLGVFYEIETNATFAGQVEVCLDYDDTGLSIDQENSLQLLHFDGTSWVDITTFVDTTSNVICGETSSFSLFAVGHTVPHPAQELIGQLIDDVSALNVKQGISNSLDAKLDRARNALDDFNNNNDAAAINAIAAFVEEVQAQRGSQISEEDADALINLALDILLLF